MASAARLLQVGRRVVSGWVHTAQAARPNTCEICCKTNVRALSRSAPVAGIFEPDDLKLEPDIPEYPPLKLQMRGYDFVILESYAKYVHGLADSLGLDTDAWAVPARSKDIHTFKPNSTVVDNKYSLKMFERVVQIESVPSPRLPILLEMMRTHAPEGVTINVKESEPEEEEFRYIPDKEMRDLRQQMKVIEDAREERRKK
ncbi:large ribosomal subunit protein mL48-like isoform X2 [Littorina saxatilis]|uniref:Small ribosomal subunit protein uS10 domain-containing protein n=1 Tax=Littorina saxatilis TaxID=31220 RepID=A0AAN9GD56_9CAEN